MFNILCLCAHLLVFCLFRLLYDELFYRLSYKFKPPRGVERSPRVRVIGVRSPVATDLSRKQECQGSSDHEHYNE